MVPNGPNTTTKNKINHVTINKRHRLYEYRVMNIWNYKEAEIDTIIMVSSKNNEETIGHNGC